MAGTKPIITKDAEYKSAKPVEKPTPSQAKVDEIREESVAKADEPAAKPAKAKKADEPAAEVPFPSQADLDAMKAGTYGNREMKSR